MTGIITAILILSAAGMYLVGVQQKGWHRRLAIILVSGGLALILHAWITRYPKADFADLVFAIASAAALVAGFKTITHPRTLYCALYFVLLVVSSSILVLMLGSQFLAVAMILIYAGAIIVVYLFAIMLAKPPPGRAIYYVNPPRAFLAVTCSIIVSGVVLFLPGDRALYPAAWMQSNVSAIGQIVLIDYVVALELAGALLLAAVIGAIAIAALRPTTAKTSEQSEVKHAQ